MGSNDDSKPMRFLSFTNDEEEKEKTAKLREAARKINEAIGLEKNLDELIEYDPNSFSGDKDFDPSKDTRPLYERLLEQRNKKQEEYDDSVKFSNQIACLDEDDIEYLNEIQKKKYEEEIRKRLEQLDRKREERRLEAERKLQEELKLKESLKKDKLGSGLHKKKAIAKSSLLNKIKVKPKLKTCEDKHEKKDK